MVDELSQHSHPRKPEQFGRILQTFLQIESNDSTFKRTRFARSNVFESMHMFNQRVNLALKFFDAQTVRDKAQLSL